MSPTSLCILVKNTLFISQCFEANIMSTYHQIILDYLDPKYHSLFFQINTYDFLDQPISSKLTQIVLKD